MVDVIGAGFGRTGTASLKVALEHLGLGPCHHMFEVIAHPELVARWERVTAGEDVGWDEVFEKLPVHSGLARLCILAGAGGCLPGRQGHPHPRTRADRGDLRRHAGSH